MSKRRNRIASRKRMCLELLEFSESFPGGIPEVYADSLRHVAKYGRTK